MMYAIWLYGYLLNRLNQMNGAIFSKIVSQAVFENFACAKQKFHSSTAGEAHKNLRILCHYIFI